MSVFLDCLLAARQVPLISLLLNQVHLFLILTVATVFKDDDKVVLCYLKGCDLYRFVLVSIFSLPFLWLDCHQNTVIVRDKYLDLTSRMSSKKPIDLETRSLYFINFIHSFFLFLYIYLFLLISIFMSQNPYSSLKPSPAKDL